MNLQDIQGSEVTEATWLNFINNAMASDIYHEVIAKTGDSSLAAAVILLDSYFDGLSNEEKVLLLRNEELFAGFAEQFTALVQGIRYDKNGYDRQLRQSYLAMIKKLLRQQYQDGKLKYNNRYEFIKTVVKFTSEANFVLECYNRYKNFYLQIR